MPCATASIKKPIHNVKEAGRSRNTGPWIAPGRISCLHLWSVLSVRHVFPCAALQTWWSLSGSNR